MKLFLKYYLLISLIIFSACQSKKIAQSDDYTIYLKSPKKSNSALKTCDEELNFWQNKLVKNPENTVYMLKMAYLLIGRFRLSGQVENLSQADSILLKTNALLNNKEYQIYYTLSQNAVTQHQFQKANNYLQKANQLEPEDKIALFLRFDVAMELGKTDLAKVLLKKIRNPKSFDYLIRQAKYQDFEGNLEEAIKTMEQALELIKNRGNQALYCWTLSNLGDMYGHAGQVRKAYQTYLKVLKINPDYDYDYALKGIAWIAFSQDKNTLEAKKILKYLFDKTKTPDIYLQMAEIAEFEGKESEKQNYLKLFYQEVKQAKYQDMYNKYLVLLESEEFKNYPEALKIAQKEVQNRPTPETYDLLAWAYFQQKDYSKALEIADKYLKDKTFEPEVLYHQACIYQALGKKAVAKKLFEEVLMSSFELGPIITKRIQQALSDLA